MREIYTFFKIILFLFVTWDVGAMGLDSDSRELRSVGESHFFVGIDNSEDPYYYKPSRSIINVDRLLEDFDKKSRIKTLDLSRQSYVDDEFVRCFCDSEKARSVINIDLSYTKITQESLKCILQGKCGTRRDYVQVSHKYGVPVSEVFLDVTGNSIDDSTIKPFSEPVPGIKIRYTMSDEEMDLSSERSTNPSRVSETNEPLSLLQFIIRGYFSHQVLGRAPYLLEGEGEVEGIKLLVVRNKERPKLRDDLLPMMVKHTPSGKYVEMTEEEKIELVEKRERERLDLGAVVSHQSHTLREDSDSPLPWFELLNVHEASIERARRDGVEDRNTQIVLKMISAGESDAKILAYIEVSLARLQELKSSLKK